jgi:protein TonB
VEEMPQFPGGPSALFEYLSKSIRYPIEAEKNGVQGRVICCFVVGPDGLISDVKVVKSVDPSLDNEAKRVIGSMPKWIPGKKNGIPVSVKYTTPVTFRLQ